jgi:hypothetical protein
MRSKIRDQAQAQLKRYSLKLGAELPTSALFL